jgi:hypothetical protein
MGTLQASPCRHFLSPLPFVRLKAAALAALGLCGAEGRVGELVATAVQRKGERVKDRVSKQRQETVQLLDGSAEGLGVNLKVP